MNLERERALVAGSARGDERAFADLVRHFAPELIRSLTILVRDADLAEDLCQESFLRAWRNLDRLRDPESFRRWLWQIGRCAAFDALRRRLRGGCEVESLDEALHDSLPGSDVSVDQILRRRELARETRGLIETLPEDAMTILRLRYEHELSYRAMAERLGLGVVQVKARLARARKALRGRLDGIAADWRRLDDERS